MTPSVGEIRAFAGSYAPLGWALCNGQTLPIAENQELYSLIGSIYGAATASTFYLPDLRGRLVVNQGTGTGRTNRPLGQQGGAESVGLTMAQVPAHTHAAMASTSAGTTNAPSGNYLAAPVDATAPTNTLQLYAPTAAAPKVVALDTSVVSAYGGNQAHENRMPFTVINYIIALQGIYPTSN